MQKTIAKIHRKFDTASEKMLAEAKAIVVAPMVNDTQKIERFQKIGFSTAKPIKDAEEMFKKQQTAQEQIEAIEYYQTYYPSYKFISEAKIQKICKKYGLLYGDSNNYLGDIPEKNLSEIEAFKMREEDYYEESFSSLWFSGRRRSGWQVVDESGSFGLMIPQMATMRSDGLITWASGVDPYGAPKEEKKQKPPFKICAPQKDFNTAGYEVKEGYKLVYDPIVIQPVKYKNIIGGLIISKWGLEGQDESLVNEISN